MSAWDAVLALWHEPDNRTDEQRAADAAADDAAVEAAEWAPYMRHEDESAMSSDVLQTIFAADSGTVFLSVVDSVGCILGISEGSQPEGKPTIEIRLTDRQRRALCAELRLEVPR